MGTKVLSSANAWCLALGFIAQKLENNSHYPTVTVTTSNNSDFTVVIVTVGSASGSLKAEPKECLTGKGQVLSKGLRA